MENLTKYSNAIIGGSVTGLIIALVVVGLGRQLGDRLGKMESDLHTDLVLIQGTQAQLLGEKAKVVAMEHEEAAREMQREALCLERRATRENIKDIQREAREHATTQ